jgi:hypothetical protein
VHAPSEKSVRQFRNMAEQTRVAVRVVGVGFGEKSVADENCGLDSPAQHYGHPSTQHFGLRAALELRQRGSTTPNSALANVMARR